jgi:hypothetical protein
MRGSDATQECLFSDCELNDFVPADHALRGIATLGHQALDGLNNLFNHIYSDRGRASIP